jgi:hypothetical protein
MEPSASSTPSLSKMESDDFLATATARDPDITCAIATTPANAITANQKEEPEWKWDSDISNPYAWPMRRKIDQVAMVSSTCIAT